MSSLLRFVLSGSLVVLCAGFIPVGSCAKGCGACARSSDDVARASRSASHVDFGRVMPRSSFGTATSLGGGRGAAIGEGLAMSRASLDEAVAALPAADGPISALARAPSPRGAAIAIEDSARSFGGDYARTVDSIGVTRGQHDKLLDAFDLTQDLVGELIDPARDDSRAEQLAQQRRRLAAASLDLKLAAILSPEQIAKLHALLGNAEIIAWRLATERPMVRRDPIQ